MQSSAPILTVNLEKICDNYKQIVKLCAPAKVSAVVKADSYGLGANAISNALFNVGCRDFFVATCAEGIELRIALSKSEKTNIYVLHGPFSNDIDNFTTYELTPVINHLDQLELWQNAAHSQKLRAILHVNTGMHRFGMSHDELDILTKNSVLAKDIKFEYIMSHLACSDEPDNPYNLLQLSKFRNILKHFPKTKACFANSGGVFLGKEYHFDMVRVGAALYGIDEHTKNPISLSAPIIQMQNLKAGMSIGYNMTYITDKDSTIATIGVGYADGYLRHFGQNTSLFIGEYEAPIVGRISMDFLTIDVTNIPKSKIFLGALVEIIGDHITPNKLAKLNNTIGYEMLTLLGKRYKKEYITKERAPLSFVIVKT
jgi:alanine racemase